MFPLFYGYKLCRVGNIFFAHYPVSLYTINIWVSAYQSRYLIEKKIFYKICVDMDRIMDAICIVFDIDALGVKSIYMCFTIT